MKEKEEKVKRNLGITLVALVVTIVVLIILATISINIIFREEGILERARQVKQDTANAQAEEDEILADYENKVNEYVSGVRENQNSSKFVTLWDEGISFSAGTSWTSVKQEIELNDSIENYDLFIIVGNHENKTSSGTFIYTVNDLVYNNDSEELKNDYSQLIMTIARAASETAIEMWFKDDKTIYISRTIHPSSAINEVEIRKVYGIKL